MDLYQNRKYQEDIRYVAEQRLPWEKLTEHSVLLSGARGMIGSFLIDVLMYRNRRYGMDCKIIGLGRNWQRAEERFSPYMRDPNFQFLAHDINEPLGKEAGNADYVLHLASNTHPVAYASDPVGTVMTNIIGTANMLEYAVKCRSARSLFASSCEIYGENRGDVEQFDEAYCGYLDPNTQRGGGILKAKDAVRHCVRHIFIKKVRIL